MEKDLNKSYWADVFINREYFIRPTIRMFTETTVSLPDNKGRSHLGGRPDLPKGMRWPKYDNTPMQFLAQINLEEISPYDEANLLPSTGFLFFFFDEEYDIQTDYFLTKRKGWKVIYYEGDLAPLRYATIPGALSEEKLFPSQSLTFLSSFSLPAPFSTIVDRYVSSIKEKEEYLQFYRQSIYQARKNIHQIFGHPNAIQGDVVLELMSQLQSINYQRQAAKAYTDFLEEMKEWQLLLQVDMRGKDIPIWNDCVFYFLIPTTALAARDFDQTWLIIQCN